MRHVTRRNALALLAGAPLAACGSPEANDQEGPPVGSLEWALAGTWRVDPDRDQYRHPLETLRFWGLQRDMTVMDVLPGLGWYTAILAPYLARGRGRYIAAGFDPQSPSIAERETLAAFESRFSNTATFGRVEREPLTPTSPSLGPQNGVDLVIMANVVHTLMAAGFAEKAFRDLFAVATPGGILGVEQHRAAPAGVQRPQAQDGYVQEAYVKTLAEEAGFTFVAASDINANPADTRDHPFGVWTLPPTLRTAPLGRPPNPRFDSEPYRAIGESDRMTLKFRKPAR